MTAWGDAFAYAWRNNLSSATVGSTTTDYLWDQTGGLPTLLDDDGTGILHGPGGPVAEIDGGDTTASLRDGLGSVRLRADEAGDTVGTADWDAWGTLRASSGSQGVHGWAGELKDPDTNLVHLRARDYSPGTGRFVQRDTVSPNAPGSQGYNPYAYTAINPVTLLNPKGHAAGACYAPGRMAAAMRRSPGIGRAVLPHVG